MSTEPQSDLIELSAEQILTVRGAANAIVDAVDTPGIEIDDQFDPVRRDHLAAASEELAEALATLASGGTWRGRMPPSEQQALRDAIGAVEAMATPPESERLRSLGYRVADDDVQALGAALGGVPAPDREDLAFSDFRFGGYAGALKTRSQYDALTDEVLDLVRAVGDAQTDADRVVGRAFSDRDQLCESRDLALTEVMARAARLHDGPDRLIGDTMPEFGETVDRAIDSDCYREMDRRRIDAAGRRIAEAVRTRDVMAENHALGAAEMIAWAQSNRLREQRIGLR